MFVKLYYWNSSGDQRSHIGQPCYKYWNMQFIIYRIDPKWKFIVLFYKYNMENAYNPQHSH